MKAIVQDRFGEPDVLRFEEFTQPSPGPDQVLVEVKAAGVDAGVWHLVAGLPYLARPFVGFRRPRHATPGTELSGVVAGVGAQVDQFQIGDEVFGVVDSAFAEFALAKEGSISPKPTNLTFAEAAAVPISGTTALQALRDAGRVKPGERVMIIGAGGGVGTFAIRIAKNLGAEVTGVCSGAKTELVTSLGADHVIDYTRTDPTAIGQKFDLIVDIAGNRSLRSLRKILTREGRLVIVGAETSGRILGGVARSIRAAILNPFVRHRLVMIFARDNQADQLVLKTLIEKGQLRPVIGRTYPLIDAADAIRYQRLGHSQGKTVLTI